jgi:two-component sensor histidine kinase
MSNNRPDLKLHIETAIVSETMTPDKAICCGLIINELVTNSIKHAFAGRTHGQITISLHRRENIFQLKVQDNGISLPADIAPGISDSFGMQLLDIFIKQLNSKAIINRNGGTGYTINFI